MNIPSFKSDLDKLLQGLNTSNQDGSQHSYFMQESQSIHKDYLKYNSEARTSRITQLKKKYYVNEELRSIDVAIGDKIDIKNHSFSSQNPYSNKQLFELHVQKAVMNRQGLATFPAKNYLKKKYTVYMTDQKEDKKGSCMINDLYDINKDENAYL